jgi:hypothetical protein
MTATEVKFFYWFTRQVQTYGHLEWLLKHEKFAHLREHSSYPQVITPCLEESYSVIFGRIFVVVAEISFVSFNIKTTSI